MKLHASGLQYKCAGPDVGATSGPNWNEGFVKNEKFVKGGTRNEAFTAESTESAKNFDKKATAITIPHD